MLGRMHCMLMDLLHGFEVLSTTEETLFNSRNVSRLVQNKLSCFLCKIIVFNHNKCENALFTKQQPKIQYNNGKIFRSAASKT